MKSPAFQFYPTDWIGSQRVQMMTLEEEGAYIRLLASCWQHGSIPSDPVMAARIIGKGASTTLATTVLTMFLPSSEEGRMVHDRLEEERSKQREWREKSSAGGKKSAALRAKSKGGSRVVEKCLQPNGNTPSPSPSPKESKTPLAPQKPQSEGKATANKATLEEVKLVCQKTGVPESDAIWFWHKCEANGWTNGGKPIKSWPHTIASWKAAGYLPSQKNGVRPGEQPVRKASEMTSQEMLRHALG